MLKNPSSPKDYVVYPMQMTFLKRKKLFSRHLYRNQTIVICKKLPFGTWGPEKKGRCSSSTKPHVLPEPLGLQEPHPWRWIPLRSRRLSGGLWQPDSFMGRKQSQRPSCCWGHPINSLFCSHRNSTLKSE